MADEFAERGYYESVDNRSRMVPTRATSTLRAISNCQWGGLAILLIVSFLFGGCGNQVPDGKEVLRFSFWGGFLELESWKEMKKTFEKKYPDVYLKLEYSPGSDNPSNLVSRMLAGSAADVMMIDDDGLCFLASKGYLAPLDDWIERDREELRVDEFMPTALESTFYDGNHWAIPFDGFCQLVFVNLDLFHETGVPLPTEDWTWDDFIEISKKLTIDKDGDGRYDQFGSIFFLNLLDSLCIFEAYGAKWMNPEKTRITIDSQEALDALDVYTNLLFRKKSMPNVTEMGMMQTEVLMLTGKVAMGLAQAYVMITMKSIEGDRWDVYHVPRGPKGRATRVSWDGIGIFSNISDEKKELAWKWIKHVLSPESQRMIGDSARALPVRPDDALASFVDPLTPQHEERFLEAMQGYPVLIPQMLATKRWRTEAESVLAVFASESANEWGKAVMRGEDLNNPMYKGDPYYWMTPQKALSLCQERCQAIVDEFFERGY